MCTSPRLRIQRRLQHLRSRARKHKLLLCVQLDFRFEANAAINTCLRLCTLLLYALEYQVWKNFRTGSFSRVRRWCVCIWKLWATRFPLHQGPIAHIVRCGDGTQCNVNRSVCGRTHVWSRIPNTTSTFVLVVIDVLIVFFLRPGVLFLEFPINVRVERAVFIPSMDFLGGYSPDSRPDRVAVCAHSYPSDKHALLLYPC